MSSSDPSRQLPKEPAPAAAGDPSMEDILASIRRILSEDEPPPALPMPNTGAGDVLLLEASMLVADPVAPANPNLVEPSPMQAEPDAAPPGQLSAHQPPTHQPTVRVDAEPVGPLPQREASLAGLVAPEAAAAAASSVGSLIRSIATERATQVYSGGPTIEDVVRAELRPLLKQWLDENLPPMVERLVRSELERVIGRAIP